MARLLASFALTIAVTVFTSHLPAGEADKQLDIYWVDVEGGAATLAVTPKGESILFDSGNPGRRDAQRIFDVAVKVAGLRKIDHLVTTHYHSDHFGGAATLATLIPIGAVYDNGEFEGGKERPSKEYLEFKADKRVVLNPGDTLPLAALDASSPKLEIKCLATRQKFISGDKGSKNADEGCVEFRPKDRDTSDNANSIVSLLSFGNFRFFDGGDLTWNMEQQLVCPVNLVGQVDVYQATHHGLDISNNPAVIRSLAPTVVVMNNGVTKGCMPATFAAIKSVKSIQTMYQLHKNLRADSENNMPDEYIANLPEKCDGNYVKLSVDPAAKTYTFSIPANKHEKKFEVKGSAAK